MNKNVIIVLVLFFALVPAAWVAAEDLPDTVGVKGGFIVCVGVNGRVKTSQQCAG